MLSQTIQVITQAGFDWITFALAVGTGILALATLWLGWQTRDAVKVAQREAEATVALGTEARRDRELAIQPVLRVVGRVLPGDGAPQITLRNVGRGPAIRTRAWQWYAGEWFWTEGPGETVPAAEQYPTEMALSQGRSWRLSGRRGAAVLAGIPGSGAATEDLWVYCLDQLGNALQFNLRTGNPPEVSRRDDEPKAWVSAIYDYE